MTHEQKIEAAEQAISETCDQLKSLLLEKNKAYGNAAFEPKRVFSKADPKEQIRVRMDDKLSRLEKGQNAGEDPFWDLAGYIILERAFDRYHAIINPKKADDNIESLSKIELLKKIPTACVIFTSDGCIIKNSANDIELGRGNTELNAWRNALSIWLTANP